MRGLSILLILTGILATEISAQEHEVVSTTNAQGFCIPSVIGLPRPKGIVYTHEFGAAHAIRSTGRNGFVLENSATIRQYRKRELKVKAPLLNNPGFKLALGFKYRVDDIFFDDIQNNNDQFYTDFQDKNFKSIGTSLYALKPLIGNKFILVRGAINFNGDFRDKDAGLMEYARLSLAPMFGVRKSVNQAYGIGLAYTQNFGRLNFYPLLMYNNTFTKNIGVELLLPKSAKLRVSTNNKKNFFYFINEITGSAYKVNPESIDPGFIRRTDYRIYARYEREIYDFLWFGVSAGYRHNINFEYSEDANFRNSVIVDNVLNESFFTNVSIFLVPPKKFGK